MSSNQNLNMGFKCNYCEKEPFELKKFLDDHLAMKHNLEFPCCQCNEAFVDQKMLAEHLSIHNGFQKVFVLPFGFFVLVYTMSCKSSLGFLCSLYVLLINYTSPYLIMLCIVADVH